MEPIMDMSFRHPNESLRSFLQKTLVGVLFLLLVLMAYTHPAQGAKVEHLDLTSLYKSDLRAMAMGNAFGPIARGDTAMAYNPAGLAQLGLEFNVGAGLAIEGTEGGFLEETYALSSQSSVTTAEAEAYLNTYMGTKQQFRSATFYSAYLAVANIGLGASNLNQSTITYDFADVDSSGNYTTGDTLQAFDKTIKISFMSAAFPLMDEQLLVGATVKSYEYLNQSSDAELIAAVVNSNFDLAYTTSDTYTGTATDIGFLYRLESMAFLRPQMSLVAYNVGGTELKHNTNPLEVPATYNWGMIFQPEVTGLPLHVMASVELEDITGAVKVKDKDPAKPNTFHDRSTKQRLHAGVEVGVWSTTGGNNVLNARAGVNRGFVTYGYELNLFGFTRFVYTHFKDNLGYVDYQDIRTSDAYQLSIHIGF